MERRYEVQITTQDGRFIAVMQNVSAEYIDNVCQRNCFDVVDIQETIKGLVEVVINSDNGGN